MSKEASNKNVFVPNGLKTSVRIIASYYRQLSVDIKIKIIRLKPVLLVNQNSYLFVIRGKLSVMRSYT